MNIENKIGIWMDHSIAHLIELTSEPGEIKTVESTFTHQEKMRSLNKSESSMHNKEQREQNSYFKELGDIIKNYDEVLLFGPTSAIDELANTLRADSHFEKIKIDVKSADKMTDNQKQAFVRDYFM